MRKSRMFGALALAFALVLPPTAVHAATTEETQTASIEVMEAINPLFPNRGNNMARQSAGIVLETGAVFEARVTSSHRVSVDILAIAGADDLRFTLPDNGEWVRVTARDASAVFFRNQDSTVWSESPTVEYRVVSGGSTILPEYRYGDDQDAFLADWEASGAAFALVVDDAVTIQVPRGDIAGIREMATSETIADLDDVITFYRNLIGTYDEWTGIEEDPASDVNRQVEHRYFVRADATGSGAAYYSPNNWTAMNASSVQTYLRWPDGWLVLHEVAHGYDNIMWSPHDAGDISLGEVYNNVYTHLYQEHELGVTPRIFGDDKAAVLAADDQNRISLGAEWNLNERDVWERLRFIVRMVELTGIDGFQTFNQQLREVPDDDTLLADIRQNDRLNRFLGTANGYNFTAWFETNNLTLDPAQRTLVMDEQPTPLVLPLNELVDNAERSAEIAETIGADTGYALVTPSDLAGVGITSAVTVTATTTDAALIEGRNVTLWDGTTQIATAPFIGGTASFPGVPVGAYTVRFPYDANNAIPASTWVAADADGGEVSADYTVPLRHEFGAVNFDLLGIGNALFAELDYDHSASTLTLNDHLNAPHVYFSSEYAHISVVSPSGDTLLSRDFIGDTARTAERTVTVDAAVGTTITYRHAEGGRSVARSAVTGDVLADFALSGKASVTFVVTGDGLERQDAAGTALVRLTADIAAEIADLRARHEAHPEGVYSTDAALLISAINALPPAEQLALVITDGVFLDALLQASRGN